MIKLITIFVISGCAQEPQRLRGVHLSPLLRQGHVRQALHMDRGPRQRCHRSRLNR